jgi:hypothetical protein
MKLLKTIERKNKKFNYLHIYNNYPFDFGFEYRIIGDDKELIIKIFKIRCIYSNIPF